MAVRNILFVDDDHEDSEFFTTAMRQISPDTDVEVAFTTTEMFQHLQNEVPDLLFIDSFLQQESGPDNIIRIREMKGCNNLPIIMYTGASDETGINRAFEAGATAYLVKPPNLGEIRKMMERLLQLAAAGELSSVHGKYYMDGEFRKPAKNL